MNHIHDLIVVGAGPAGLACAIEARRAGLDTLVIEKNTVVNTIVGYPIGVTFFSTPDLLSIGGYPFTTPHMRPTREEAIQYYRGVVRAEKLSIELGALVVAIVREEGELLRVVTDRGEHHARSVALATGYFDHTNRLGVEGEDLPKVHHYYREPYEYFDRDVLVIGGRNSAVEASLDLWRHGARVTMVHRGEEFHKGVKYWIRPDIDNRIRNHEITMLWNTEVVAIEPEWVVVRNNETGRTMTIRNDAVFAMIGYRPDADLMTACGIDYDPETLVPVFDPATLETSVPNLFIVGSVACGCRTWEIFIENGREHAAIVAAEVARRFAGPSGGGEEG